MEGPKPQVHGQEKTDNEANHGVVGAFWNVQGLEMSIPELVRKVSVIEGWNRGNIMITA